MSHDDDDDDFDLENELREGAIIGDVTRGGYDVAWSGKHIAHTSEFDDALIAVLARMEREKFYPNVFHVNDHGNVDLLSVKARTRKGKIVGASYKVLRSWV